MTDKRSKTSAVNGKLGGRPKELLDFEALPNENWRPVSFNKNYFISDLGRVVSAKENKIKTLKIIITTQGYCVVSIFKHGVKQQFRVHRLVLEAFEGDCPKGMSGSHLNGNRGDNRLTNLVWETLSDNHKRKKEHGTWQGGSNNGKAKINETTAMEIKTLLASGKTIVVTAKKVGVSKDIVANIKQGKTWNHIK